MVSGQHQDKYYTAYTKRQPRLRIASSNSTISLKESLVLDNEVCGLLDRDVFVSWSRYKINMFKAFLQYLNLRVFLTGITCVGGQSSK